MSPMAEAIVDTVRLHRSGVSFVELENSVKGFGGGNLEIGMLERNIVLWAGVTSEAVDALEEAQPFIEWRPSSWFVYLFDGKALTLPLAKTARHYKKPRWLPVTFRMREGVPA